MSTEIFKLALKEVLGAYPGPGEKDPQQKAFYDEIVTRCVADVAGMLQTSTSEMDINNPKALRYGYDTKFRANKGQARNKEEETLFGAKPASELHAMFKAIAKNQSEEQLEYLTKARPDAKPAHLKEVAKKQGAENARNLILNNLSSFTKGIVYTPHPTEMLDDDAIEAQEKLMRALVKTSTLFENLPYMSSDERGSLVKELKGLTEAIKKPLSKQLSIDQEMRRSIRFSQRQFDSIPGIVDAILTATDLERKPPASSELSFEQLKQFGHLLEPATWSPGDQDSKPDMTAEKLQKGSDLSRRAIMFHYYRTLAALGANTPSEESRIAIEKVMARLLKSGCDAYDPPKEPTAEIARMKLTDVSEVKTHGNTAFSERFSSYNESEFFNNFIKRFDAQYKNAKPFENNKYFLDALGDLRNREDIKAIRDRSKPRKSITVIDSLIIQAMNFKDAALRIQVRQNAERHSEVVDTLLDQLPKDVIPVGVKTHLHPEDNSSSAEALLAAFKSDDKFRTAVQDKVRANLSHVRAELKKLPPEEKTPEAYQQALSQVIEKVGRKNYDMYQVTETMGLAAKNPDKISRYLIAECRSKTHMMEAFFLLKVMESIEAPKAEHKVEIVPLVEHPDLAMDKGDGIPAARMMAAAMENEQFRAHHLSITSSNHLLDSYSLKDGKHTLTVAEAKNRYGIKPAAGDETRKIEGVKMMMGAGSDITKAGSVAAAAAMMDVMEKTREGLLNGEHPVLLIDYIGCGGGIHRSQPVASSFETVQGQSMRQLPENIVQKVLGLLTDFLRRDFALNPDKKRVAQADGYLAKTTNPELMSRVNMGNLAGLAQNDALWEAHTKPRTYAMMEKYGELYKSDEFKELMSYSADMYANMTKFAARPADRVGATPKPKGFLVPVDVKETRAIGFGAALNTAGICAPLFFGGSEYLKSDGPKDDATLRQMYLYDPKAQDTINRMTYGVIMADMDVAWKYQGHAEAPTPEELVRMAAGNPVFADKANPTQAERQAIAEKCLAEINLEYNQVAGKLLRLHQSLSGQRMSQISDGKQASEELLKLLPVPLKEQLSFSREHIKKPREELAELFKNMLGFQDKQEGSIDPKSVTKNLPKTDPKFNADLANNPDNLTDVYKNTIYPAMGAIFECFEHTPRAYTRPKWVAATEPQQQQGRG